MQDGNSPTTDLSERKAALRTRAERERMRDAGFIWLQAWVHAEDAPALRKRIVKLKAKRIAEEEGG